MRPALRLNNHQYSPTIYRKIVLAGGHCSSFDKAAVILAELADIDVNARQVGRLTHEVGREMASARDAALDDLPPQTQRDQPRTKQPPAAPEAVVVEVDGGRLNTRQAGHGLGVHQPHPRENKIGLLAIIDGPTFDVDPHPEPLACFLVPSHVVKLVRELHNRPRGSAIPPEEALLLPTSEPDNAAGPASLAAVESPSEPPWRPERVKRICVATMAGSEAFGKMVAHEAYQQQFYRASRRAFVADGLAYNWTIYSRHFAEFVGITDFCHALAYVYAAALAIDGESVWQRYGSWLRACWQGRVAEVIAELEQWQSLHPMDESEKAASTDSREVVRRSLGYLRNNQARMDYSRYRRDGLPCMSSWMESLVKEMNARVKGTEKYWNAGANAESILQVRAALLSDDGRLDRHLATRPVSPFRRATVPGSPCSATAA